MNREAATNEFQIVKLSMQLKWEQIALSLLTINGCHSSSEHDDVSKENKT